jgi:hypothetical protein
MMNTLKHFVFIIFLFMTSNCFIYAAAYDTVSVGIMPFSDIENNNKKSDAITGQLTDIFSKYKFMSLVERSKIDKLIKEIKFGMSGLVDENTVAQAGSLRGIKILMEGTFQKNKITARAIQVETGKIIATCSIKDESEIDILCKKIASGIEIFLARENLKTMRNDSPSIKLDFWLQKEDKSEIKSKGTMKIGDSVIFNAKSNESGYLSIVDIQSNGDIVILYPNDMALDNKISADKIYSIPSSDNGFKIIVSEPLGQDTVVAFFTKKKVDWLDRNKLSGEGFWTVKENEKLPVARGLKIVASSLKASDWESNVLEIEVEK